MRYTYRSMLAVAAVVLSPAASVAQNPAPAAAPPSGITAPGWKGLPDATDRPCGPSAGDVRMTKEGEALHVSTGAATTFWNPANAASGNYTVSATFAEPKFMGLCDHPHPYGVWIAGNDIGTGNHSLLYCAAYGNGTFIVRGFGPAPFAMGGRRSTANDAVHKAAGPGQPVSQTIALSVKGDSVSCAINGTVVATYAKSALVVPGQLKSTDGLYGVRFSHNTEAVVTGFAMKKN